MGDSEKSELKYLPQRCPFLNKAVWAILTRQTEGNWRVVHCLDKHHPCFEHNFAFIVDGGDWPFADPAIRQFTHF